MIADVYEITESDEPLIIEMRFRPHRLEPKFNTFLDLKEYAAEYKYLYSLQADTYADIVVEFYKAQGWTAEQRLLAVGPYLGPWLPRTGGWMNAPSISPPVGGDLSQSPFGRILTWTVFEFEGDK
jgi:hypothetical protein